MNELMKKRFWILSLIFALTAGYQTCMAQFNLKGALQGAVKAAKAAALTDSQLGNLSEALVNESYSKKQENEADDYGYDFLKQHGKNPWAMSLSFRKLKQLEEQAGSSNSNVLNQLFSSHPDLDNRIKRMEEKATKDGIAKPE